MIHDDAVPVVSVIIPSYNHARFLRQRIDTVLGQTYRNMEIIILDDCSQDESQEVIREYQDDKRVRVVLNEVNSGCVFKQWNKGLALAHGKYVWIAESDDYSDPEFLATMVERLQCNPAVGLAFCDSFQVSGNSIELARELWYQEFAAEYANDFIANGREYVISRLLHVCCIVNASSAVFRRSVALKAGPADVTLKLSGDWRFWVSLLSHCDLAYVANPLNYFRCHEQSVRHTTIRNGVYLEEAYRVTLEIIKEFRVPSEDVVKAREKLTTLYVETMFSHSADIPRARRHRIRRLADRMYRFSSIRLWYWQSGLHWLWLGCRRRLLDLLGCAGTGAHRDG
jgi:glycosyltransferase involved in cell wall biosynthesis